MPDTCAVCVKLVLDTEEGIECDGVCKRWFHRECCKISKAEYQRMSSNNNNKWYCSRTDCVDRSMLPLSLLTTQMNAVISKLDVLLGRVEKIDAISKDIADIKSDMSMISSQVSALEPRVAGVEERVTEIAGDVRSLNLRVDQSERAIGGMVGLQDGSNVESLLEESNERTRRANNLIVFNIPEAKSKETAVRVRHDSERVQSLINVVCPSQADLSFKCYRLGNANKKQNRPLKLILPSPQVVIDIMKNFDKNVLKNTDPTFADVGISRDRTPREREYLNKLRDQLKVRSANGERDLTIKYINGTPKIVKQASKN